MTRNPFKRSAHNKGIRREAEDLKKMGWNVRADLPGNHYPEPDLVAGHRPDIHATKQGGTRIVEIETDRDADPSQHESFRGSAAQQDSVRFYGRVVDERGRRIESFGNVPGDVLG